MARPSAQARARRLLSMVHLLKPNTVVPLQMIADAVGITKAEVTEDLERLACCGLHPYSPDQLVPLFIEDGELVVFGQMPALDRAVRLSSREAQALAAALQTAGLTGEDALVSKLLDAAAAAETSADDIARVVRAAVAPGTGEMLKALAQGLEESRLVRITHHAAGRDAATQRDIEPLSLFNERENWYVEAFCRRAGALRTFRLDRISSATVLSERFDRRDLSPSGVPFTTEGLPVARIHLAPGEEFSSRSWPGASLVAEDADGAIVEVPYAGTDWIARQVAARLGGARVLEPTEVREAVRVLAESGPGA
ncbi:MAG: WYL domain-containing protein [Coriobacteriia bacterium]|nr:WYL domain-containing protein [Coriobacteriia bacterium]